MKESIGIYIVIILAIIMMRIFIKDALTIRCEDYSKTMYENGDVPIKCYEEGK